MCPTCIGAGVRGGRGSRSGRPLMRTSTLLGHVVLMSWFRVCTWAEDYSAFGCVCWVKWTVGLLDGYLTRVRVDHLVCLIIIHFFASFLSLREGS